MSCPPSCRTLLPLAVFTLAASFAAGCGEESAGGDGGEVDQESDAAGDEDATGDPGVESENHPDAPEDSAGEEAGDAAEDLPPDGSWRAENGFIMDPQGRRAILRGVNMAGSHRAEGGHGYLGPDTPEFYAMFADAGFNTLRFLTTWAAVMPDRGAVDEDYLDRLEERLDWAGTAGLLVFIDMHQDLYGEGFQINGQTLGDGAPVWSCPNDHQLTAEQSSWFLYYLDPKVIECFDHFWDDPETQDYFVQAWRTIAERAASHDNVIGIDPLNEPYWGSAWRMAAYENESMLPLFERVVTEARASRPDLIAFIEPGSVKSVTGRTGLAAFPFDNAVYAPHMYNSAMESGGNYSHDLHYPAFQDMISTDIEEAAGLESALLIGEWGSGIEDSANVSLFLQDILPLLDGAPVSWTVWEAGPGGGYCMTSDTGTFKDWASWLIYPYPERVSGGDLTFGYDHAMRRLTLGYTAGPYVALPTIIAVPASFGEASLVSSANVRTMTNVGGGAELYAETPLERVDAVLAW